MMSSLAGLWKTIANKKEIVKNAAQQSGSIFLKESGGLPFAEGAAGFKNSVFWQAGAATWAGAKFMGRSALDPKPFRGFLNRTIIGGTVGAGVGMANARTDYESDNLNAKNLLLGAVVGAAGGVAAAGVVSAGFAGAGLVRAKKAGGFGRLFVKDTMGGWTSETGKSIARGSMKVAGTIDDALIATTDKMIGGAGRAARAAGRVATSKPAMYGAAGAAVGTAAMAATPVVAAGGLAYGAGRLAWAFPRTAMAIGAAGVMGAGAGYLGASYAARPVESPTLAGADMNVNYVDQTSAARELMSDQMSPMGQVMPAYSMGPSLARLQASTEGLTQGLHRGRHG
jgi:hypothetical protein